jgi:hypothetical protein
MRKERMDRGVVNIIPPSFVQVNGRTNMPLPHVSVFIMAINIIYICSS